MRIWYILLNPICNGVFILEEVSFYTITFTTIQQVNKSRSESYSVLSPFLSKLRYTYRRNRQNLFYLLVYFKFESEIAVKSESVFVCSISKTLYFLLVLHCSKSIIHQSNGVFVSKLSHDLANVNENV